MASASQEYSQTEDVQFVEEVPGNHRCPSQVSTKMDSVHPDLVILNTYVQKRIDMIKHCMWLGDECALLRSYKSWLDTCGMLPEPTLKWIIENVARMDEKRPLLPLPDRLRSIRAASQVETGRPPNVDGGRGTGDGGTTGGWTITVGTENYTVGHSGPEQASHTVVREEGCGPAATFPVSAATNSGLPQGHDNWPPIVPVPPRIWSFYPEHLQSLNNVTVPPSRWTNISNPLSFSPPPPPQS